MPHVELVELKIDPSVRKLCARPYEGHKKGCPNYGKCERCPPKAPHIGDVIDVHRAVYAVWSEFDLASHVTRLRDQHPDWSDRQLRCCLYWQGTARKRLKSEIDAFLELHPTFVVVTTPEACGVDVTSTMSSIGVRLEWPPIERVVTVAIAGEPIVRVESNGGTETCAATKAQGG